MVFEQVQRDQSSLLIALTQSRQEAAAGTLALRETVEDRGITAGITFGGRICGKW